MSHLIGSINSEAGKALSSAVTGPPALNVTGFKAGFSEPAEAAGVGFAARLNTLSGHDDVLGLDQKTRLALSTGAFPLGKDVPLGNIEISTDLAQDAFGRVTLRTKRLQELMAEFLPASTERLRIDAQVLHLAFRLVSSLEPAGPSPRRMRHSSATSKCKRRFRSTSSTSQTSQTRSISCGGCSASARTAGFIPRGHTSRAATFSAARLRASCAVSPREASPRACSPVSLKPAA